MSPRPARSWGCPAIHLDSWKPESEKALLEAHRILTQKTDSAPFIAFMLRMLLDTMTCSTPEVRLLSILAGEMTRQQLKEALGLIDSPSLFTSLRYST
jgi:hypothetical protein